MECIKSGFIAFARDAPPTIAVEFARQSIPHDLKPDYIMVEKEIERNKLINKILAKNG